MRLFLALALAGCSGPIAARPPAAPPLEIPKVATAKVDVATLAEGQPLPTGCFARSRKTGAWACITGQFRLDGEEPRRFEVLLPDASSGPTIELALPLPPETRARVNDLLRDGDYALADEPPVKMAVGAEQVFHHFHVDLRQTTKEKWVDFGSTRGHPGVAYAKTEVKGLLARVTVDQVPGVVTHDPHDPLDPGPAPGEDDPSAPRWSNELAEVDCESASLSVREPDPQTLLVERECRAAGLVYIAATLCAFAQGRCD